MKPDQWSIALEIDPDLSVRSAILEPLIAYNEEVAGRADGGLLVVTVRDDAGVVVGDLWGRVSRGFVFVAFLAEPVLAEARERWSWKPLE